jgi:hypothetical protein
VRGPRAKSADISSIVRSVTDLLGVVSLLKVYHVVLTWVSV